MTKAEVRKLLINIRDKCKNPKFKTTFEGAVIGEISDSLYNLIKAIGGFDQDYFEHMKNIGDDFENKINTLSFQECHTILTYMLRSEHWSPGLLAEYLENGSVYALLVRMNETL